MASGVRCLACCCSCRNSVASFSYCLIIDSRRASAIMPNAPDRCLRAARSASTRSRVIGLGFGPLIFSLGLGSAFCSLRFSTSAIRLLVIRSTSLISSRCESYKSFNSAWSLSLAGPRSIPLILPTNSLTAASPLSYFAKICSSVKTFLPLIFSFLGGSGCSCSCSALISAAA